MPVEESLVAGNFRSVGRPFRRLGHWFDAARLQISQCTTGRKSPNLCKFIMQTFCRRLLYDTHPVLSQDRAGIETFIHLHDGHTSFVISGHNGPLDRRRAAPSRQQRHVNIDAAQTWGLQNFFGKDQTVGHHNNQIRIKFSKVRYGVWRFKVIRRQNRNAPLFGESMDRCGCYSMTSP